MGYQPAVLADGSIAAVYAANLGLSPRPAGTGIHVLKRTFGPESRLAGAIVSGAAGDAYGGAQGLAPPSACSPAALPDGRILFSYSPGARGDFGIYVMNADGSHLSRVIDLPGTLELDATPIVRHAGPPPVVPLARDDFSAPPDTFLFAGHKGIRYADGFLESGRSLAPVDSLWEIPRRAFAFRFRDLDVFADGPSGSPAHGAAPRMLDARIRFFALLSRPEREGGDAIVLLREAPVADNGEVNETDLPADVPMFEQLVDSHGHVLMTAHGPAHVAGSNSGVAGLTTRCVGCHLGHSTLPVPPARGATRQPTNGSRP